MFRHSLVVITILLVSFGSPVVLKAQQPLVGGHGVYRPLNWLRQLKLGTAYFVNPCLPGEVGIYNAYKLTDLEPMIIADQNQGMPEQTESGQLWLAVQIPNQPALTLTIPCQPGTRTSASQEASADNSPCDRPWIIQNHAELQRVLQNAEKEGLYVLSPQEHLFSLEGQGVISWDPEERVDTIGNLYLYLN